MKVLYDYQAFKSQKYGGISRYFFELIRANKSITPQLSVLFTHNHYISNHYNFILKNNTNENVDKIIRKLEFVNKIYTNKILATKNFDVFHPTYYNPYFLNKIKNKPYVVTVHDMIHEKFPQFFSKKDKTSIYKQRVVKEASRVIAISENTKEDIIKILGIPEHKIDVIYHGNSIKTTSENVTLKKTKKDYILFVGNRDGYKNFIFFVKSIVPLLKKNPSISILCLGGGKFSKKEEQFFLTEGINFQLHQVNAKDSQIPFYYSNALLFVFPSIYEGFGMPILESFACKCPVVCSDTSCFKEIAKNGALYFNPFSTESIYCQVKLALERSSLREELVLNGSKRINFFSWKKTAEQTITTYKKVI